MIKAALDPIRKLVERALMRPLDLTSEWITAQSLKPALETQAADALREVFLVAAQMSRNYNPYLALPKWRGRLCAPLSGLTLHS